MYWAAETETLLRQIGHACLMHPFVLLVDGAFKFNFFIEHHSEEKSLSNSENQQKHYRVFENMN